MATKLKRFVVCICESRMYPEREGVSHSKFSSQVFVDFSKQANWARNKVEERILFFQERWLIGKMLFLFCKGWDQWQVNWILTHIGKGFPFNGKDDFLFSHHYPIINFILFFLSPFFTTNLDGSSLLFPRQIFELPLFSSHFQCLWTCNLDSPNSIIWWFQDISASFFSPYTFNRGYTHSHTHILRNPTQW